MRYYYAKEADYVQDTAFRFYMAKGMQACAAMAGWKLPDYGDLINPKPVDNRTGEEIAADLIMKLGLQGGE